MRRGVRHGVRHGVRRGVRHGVRRDKITISALASGSGVLGSRSLSRRQCVWLGKTLYSHSACLHPGANRLI